MAAALGMSESTYARREAGKWPAGDRNTLIPAIQRVTGAPLWFLEDGWEGRPEQPGDIQAQIAALADGVVALASGRAEDALRAARAATGQRRHGTA